MDPTRRVKIEFLNFRKFERKGVCALWQFFTERSKRVIQLAHREALRLGHPRIGTEHLMIGLIMEESSVAALALKDAGLIPADVIGKILEMKPGGASYPQPVDLALTERARSVLNRSIHEARGLHSSYVGTEHLLLGVLLDEDCIACKALSSLGLNIAQLRDALKKRLLTAQNQNEKERAADEDDPAPSQTPTVDKLCVDLTAKARAGALDPLIGRETETRHMMQILCRRRKNNPVLVGEPGVGKTAIVEGLAFRISEGQVPPMLRGKRVVELNMGTVVAGTKYRGEFEDRMKKLVDELSAAKNVILFIDELHTVVGAGSAEGSLDAANILKPSLARGDFQVIGATTLDEFRKSVEKDAALERRFQSVIVGEPDQDAALAILQGLKSSYEKHHSVRYTDSALEAAVRLSSRYLSDRSLPDKAIDLIDEAAAKVRLDLEDSEIPADLTVGEDQIADVLSEWSGIPVKTLTEAEATRYLRLESEIHQRLVGQDEAVTALCRAVRRSRSGLKDPRRPVGSFLFLGPSGVGKTELARCLARSLFGSEKALLAFDMSEYMERHEVAKLIGAPPGYVGHEDEGRLTEAVRRHPWSVVLFDEVEKASPDLFNLLLQILEEGRLTDSHGRTVDFRNTVIVMTSNLGAREMEKSGFGFSPSSEAESKKRAESIKEAVKAHFRPEFLNRLDAQLIFHPLTEAEMEQVFDIMMFDLGRRLGERGIILSVSREARQNILKAAVAQNQGARPLRRLIQTRIEDPLSDLILSGEIKNGATVDCRTTGDENQLAFSLRAVHSRKNYAKKSKELQLQP